MYQRSSMVPRITQCKRHGRGAWGNRFAWTAWGRDAAGSFAWPIPFGGYKLGTAPAFNPSNSINLVSGLGGPCSVISLMGQSDYPHWAPQASSSYIVPDHSQSHETVLDSLQSFLPLFYFINQSYVTSYGEQAEIHHPSYLCLQLFSWQSSPAAVREELQKRLVDMEKVLLWSHPVKIWTLQTESIHDNYW
jgi:hypothetical protein